MKKIIKNILIENQFTEFVGKKHIGNSLKIFKENFIITFLPFFIIKVKNLNKQQNNNKVILNNKIKKSKKIIFHLNFELPKKKFLSFNYYYYYKQLRIEIKAGGKFFFSLTKRDINNFSFAPCVYSITNCCELFGMKRVGNILHNIGESLGFSRCYFFLKRIYPYQFIKEMEFFPGLKFIQGIFFHPIVISIFCTYGYTIWLYNGQKKINILSQISNLKIFSFRKFKLLFVSLECSLYLSVINNSFLLTYRVWFDKNKNFLKIESLGKWEDFLISSLLDIYWHKDIHIYLIGGFIDGEIFIWNEFLNPIIQFFNPSFSIFNFGIGERSPFFFLLKKNPLNIRNFGKKKFLKFLPQTMLSELNVSKLKKTENLNKEWFLMKNIDLDLLKKIFKNFYQFSIHNTNDIRYLLKFNRLYLYLIDCLSIKFLTFQNSLKLGSFINLFNKKNLIKNFGKEKILSKFRFILYIIGTRRFLTRQEIEKEQVITGIYLKKFGFARCFECSRIWKVISKRIKKSFCPFCHFFNYFYSFNRFEIYTQNPKNCSKWEFFQKNQTNFYNSIFKKIPRNNFSFIKVLQKTMNWGAVTSDA
jgi:hypothetical protein